MEFEDLPHGHLTGLDVEVVLCQEALQRWLPFQDPPILANQFRVACSEILAHLKCGNSRKF